METVLINKEILEQMGRQIDFAYFFSAGVVSLAIVVFGYQVFINQRTINKLRKENEILIKEMTAPFFIRNIDQLLQNNIVEYNVEVKNIVDIFNKSYKENRAIRIKMNDLRDACLRFPKTQMIILNPEHLTNSNTEDESVDISVLQEKIKAEITESNELTTEKRAEYLASLDKLYSTYKKIEKEFNIN